jgi:ubiquinone/menaquinone biosynthesis C-methylase UbiE
MEFAACDVENVAKILDKKFDLIYIFHALYAFPNKLAALTALRKVAKDNAQLVIFAYINRDNYKGSAFSLAPVSLPDLQEMLKSSGWKLTEVEDLDAEHERWYIELLERIANKRDRIINAFGEEPYNYMRGKYLSILQAIQDKQAGGAIVRAFAEDKICKNKK